jgi:putative sigma-54 modulation protein
MRIEIMAKDTSATERLFGQIEKKCTSRLSKYFSKDPEALANTVVNVRLRERKPMFRMDIEMPYFGFKLNAEHSTSDSFLAALDKCLDILDRQIGKYRTRLQKIRTRPMPAMRVKTMEAPSIEDEAVVYKIIRVEDYEMKPMSVEDAVTQMELNEHAFYFFHNLDTKTAGLVYRREDGNIGLIEAPE